MNQETFFARIHVLLARESEYGVVIRRGPSRYTCFIGWGRQKDSFEPAQWLKGRVYGRRSDLSPDGKHLIYFAMNGRKNSEAKGAWTAISKSPWMKAIALYAKGDCWHGGGLFLDNHSYWLNDGYGHQVIRQTNEVIRDTSYRPGENYGYECTGVYYIRLQRDGWVLKNLENTGNAVFEKILPYGWRLQKIAHAQTNPPRGKGCYWDEHLLINSKQEVQIHPDWEWADWDDQRILWASQGCLKACSIVSGTELSSEKMLYDFNSMQFQPIKAPY